MDMIFSVMISDLTFKTNYVVIVASLNYLNYLICCLCIKTFCIPVSHFIRPTAPVHLKSCSRSFHSNFICLWIFGTSSAPGHLAQNVVHLWWTLLLFFYCRKIKRTNGSRVTQTEVHMTQVALNEVCFTNNLSVK